MENIYYGEDRIVEIMQDAQSNPSSPYRGNEGVLFYVSHNTEEMFNDFLDYCTANSLPVDEESSAIAFLRHVEELL